MTIKAQRIPPASRIIYFVPLGNLEIDSVPFIVSTER